MDLALKERRSYIVEVLTPKQDDPELEKKLGVCEERWPEGNLRLLHAACPTAGAYLSMLSLKADWRGLLPRLPETMPAGPRRNLNA